MLPTSLQYPSADFDAYDNMPAAVVEIESEDDMPAISSHETTGLRHYQTNVQDVLAGWR